MVGDDLVIRRATATDADAVHVTLLAAFEPLRARYTPGAFDATVLDPARVAERLGEGPIWVAETGGGVVGTFGVRHRVDGCYLRGMGVTPAARGLGAGRRLLEEAVAFAAASEASRTWLYTTAFLHAAIHLYESVGFERFAEDPPPVLAGTPLVGMHLPGRSQVSVHRPSS